MCIISYFIRDIFGPCAASNSDVERQKDLRNQAMKEIGAELDQEEREALRELEEHQKLEHKCFFSFEFCCTVVLPCVLCPFTIAGMYYLVKYLFELIS